MERKIGFLIILFVLVPMLLAASYKTRIYQAYVKNDMQAWKFAMDEMQQQNNSDVKYLSELVNYQYGYIGYCLGIDANNQAEVYLNLAEKNLERLEKLGYSSSVIESYRSAFYGYKIGLSPMKAPFIGPKSMKQGEMAIKSDPQNPLAYIQLGNAQFYMPAVFGGSKTEAIQYFQKAKKLMEEKPELWVHENWNYLSLLALIGQSFEITEQYEEAKFYYQKALETESEFSWVKNELLPNLEKIHKNE